VAIVGPADAQQRRSMEPFVNKAETLRSTDDEARLLARSLVRTSPVVSLATLSPDGFPLASLASVATDVDGAPVLLISALSGHTSNLAADARCSVLFARSGKGDRLAHARISVTGQAETVDRDSDEGRRIRRRFLARQPKAALYVDFPDFRFVRLSMRGASLNGGFGKAYELGPSDLLTDLSLAQDLLAAEADILAHMNEDHPHTVGLYAVALGGRAAGPWRMVSLDPDGFEVAAHGELARIAFPAPVSGPDAAHAALVELARQAREG
jgi:heme iron utilization protein